MGNIILENQGSVAILTINRPKALNALNEDVLEELSQCLFEVAKKTECRCLIVTGSGDKAFVAGADIKGFPEMGVDEAQGFADKGQKVFRQLEQLKIPVIAAVNGFALGGGLELALACDFIYASEKAKFGLPEVTLGLIPGFGGTVRLSRVVGLAKAREMTYRGDFIGAQEAKDLGLVNQIFSLENLLVESKRTAILISSRGPLAVAKGKKIIGEAYDVSLDEGMTLEREAFAELFSSEDQKEGAKAFIEKRSPDFRGL